MTRVPGFFPEFEDDGFIIYNLPIVMVRLLSLLFSITIVIVISEACDVTPVFHWAFEETDGRFYEKNGTSYVERGPTTSTVSGKIGNAIWWNVSGPALPTSTNWTLYPPATVAFWTFIPLSRASNDQERVRWFGWDGDHEILLGTL